MKEHVNTRRVRISVTRARQAGRLTSDPACHVITRFTFRQCESKIESRCVKPSRPTASYRRDISLYAAREKNGQEYENRTCENPLQRRENLSSIIYLRVCRFVSESGQTISRNTLALQRDFQRAVDYSWLIIVNYSSPSYTRALHL